MRARIEKASKAYGAMKKYIFTNRHVPVAAKMKSVRGAIEPVLTYGSECWTMTTEDERRLEVAQMKWLRNALGVTRWDMLRNEHIRTKCAL